MAFTYKDVKFTQHGEYVNPNDYVFTSLYIKTFIITKLNILKDKIPEKDFKILIDKTDNLRDRIACVTNNVLEIYGGEEILSEEINIEQYNKNKKYLDSKYDEYEKLYLEFIDIADELEDLTHVES